MTRYKTTPITASMHRTMLLNLMSLPAKQRFMGRSSPQCDFCSGANPEFMYAASRTTAGEIRDCWRWCARRECHAAITANDYKKLYERAASLFGGTDTAKGVIRAVMLAFHADAVTL